MFDLTMRRPTANVFLLLVSLALVLCLTSACTSRRTFATHSSLYQNVAFKSDDLAQNFNQNYRSAYLYEDYRTQLIVDAFFIDRNYRQTYLDTLANTYLLPQHELQSLQQQHRTAFEQQFDFLVFVYSGNNNNLDFGRSQSLWQIYLQDDDGTIIQPASITKLKPKQREVVFLKKYIHELDRWVEVYRVSFPKLNKVALQQPLGKQPLQLVMTSMIGQAKLTWNNKNVFY